jgi:uridine kinase
MSKAQKINQVISEWAKVESKLVVAIDGYSGVGKTTLLNNLAALNPDIIPVNRDDFMFPRKIVQEKLAKADDRSKIWELEACDNKKLENLVSAFKHGGEIYQIDTYDGVSGKVDTPKMYDFSKKIMVVEGVFMFHPQLSLNTLLDKRIYLEGDIDESNERRIKREKERWGKDYFPETHPDSHVRQVIIALKRYIELYQPDKIADFVLKV